MQRTLSLFVHVLIFVSTTIIDTHPMQKQLMVAEIFIVNPLLGRHFCLFSQYSWVMIVPC